MTVGRQLPPDCVSTGNSWRAADLRAAGAEKEKPQRADCPAGYRKLNKPNKYRAYCEPIDQGPPKCPADKPNGTPPNCCALGTRFTEGFCYPEKCSPGWTGSPHCQPKATQQAPTPTGPTPKKVCPSYMQGTAIVQMVQRGEMRSSDRQMMSRFTTWASAIIAAAWVALIALPGSVALALEGPRAPGLPVVEVLSSRLEGIAVVCPRRQASAQSRQEIEAEEGGAQAGATGRADNDEIQAESGLEQKREGASLPKPTRHQRG